MTTDDKERDFGDFSSLPYGGLMVPELFNNTGNAGDGYPGLQAAIRNWTKYWLSGGTIDHDVDLNSNDITGAQTISSVSGNYDYLEAVSGNYDYLEATKIDTTYYCSTRAEIVSAISDIGAGFGKIILNSGTIDITSVVTINIQGSIIIEGFGDLTVINCLQDDSLAAAFSINGAESFVMRNLKFDCTNFTDNWSPVYVPGENDSGILIDNITVEGGGSIGVGVYFIGDNVIVSNSKFENLYIGICGLQVISVYPSYFKIIGNNCLNNTKGIVINGRNGMVSTNSTASNTYGIEILGGYCNTIVNNVCRSNQQGIRFAVNNGVYPQQNTVQGNICRENTLYGIYLSDTFDNSICGNICNENNENNASDGGGIYLGSNSDSNVINNNICRYNQNAGAGTGYGINISNSNCGDNTLIGNIALSNDTNYNDGGTSTFDTDGGGQGLNNIA